MFSGVYCHIGFCGDIFIRILKSKKQRESAVSLSGALPFFVQFIRHCVYETKQERNDENFKRKSVQKRWDNFVDNRQFTQIINIV